MSCKHKLHIAGGIRGCANPEVIYSHNGCNKSCRGYEEEYMQDMTELEKIKAEFHAYKSKAIKNMEVVLNEKHELEAEISELQEEKHELEAEISELQEENDKLSMHRIPNETKYEIISLCTKIISEVNE